MDEKEFTNELIEYLDDRCVWSDFIFFMEEKGYSQSDFPKPYDEE